MIYSVPPFELGETLDGTDSDDNLINQHVLGTIYEFPAQRLGESVIGGKKGRKTGRAVRAIALRNISGATLYGKRLASLKKTADDSYGASNMALTHEVDGYTTETAQRNVVIIDEFLDTVGVADDDIFWGIINGPVTVYTQTTEDATGNFDYGYPLAAGTGAATSGNSTAGGVVGHTCDEAGMLVGIACTSTVSGNTWVEIPVIACINFI